MNTSSLKALLAELEAREEKENPQPPLIALVDPNFEKQTNFVRDPAMKKCAFTTRRAGKSSAGGIILFEHGFELPNVECLYIALTKDSARDIMWPILKEINRRHNLGAKFNEADLVVKLPNGSVINLYGADADRKLMDRLLGRKLKVVVIDEGQSWRSDLRRLIDDILEPALADLDGPIILIGTPGDVAYGLFYDITTGKEKGWTLHEWDTYDNPHMRVQWDKQIKRKIAANPAVVNTPAFRRNYLKQWVVDDEKLVYRFHPETGFYLNLLPKNLRYILGIDLGYSPDPTAFVILAYSDDSPHLYFIEGFKKDKMIISAVGEKIAEYCAKYDFEHMVIDNASKQAVEELKQNARFQFPLHAADKRDKKTFIELLNSDLKEGLVKLPEYGAEDLIKEWANLVKKWDLHHTKWIEDPALPNHLADAFLYAWRKARHYLFSPEPEKPKPGTAAFNAAREAEIEEAVERQTRIERGLEDPEEPERPWDD